MLARFKSKGSVIIYALVFIGIFFTASTGMLVYSTSLNRTQNHNIAAAQALHLAEAGIDKALYQLNQSSSYNGESNTALGDGTVTIGVANVSSDVRTITATGYVPNSANPIATRTIKVNANVGSSVISFRYGVQVGEGGFTMSGGARVNGSIYSNGNINATNGVVITGSAVAANQSIIGGDNWVGGVNVGTTGTDDAWAHTVRGASVSGTIYCQSGSSNNKSCNTSRGDPTPQAMPLTDAQIDEWKNDASAGGTISGNYNVGWAGATLGPKVITGNLTVNGGGILTVTGTLYVQGNITVNGGGQVRLASSYGANSGAIVTDGTVSLTGGSNFAGSGTPGSYPFLITTSACPAAAGCGTADAIHLSGGAGTVALIAQNGNVRINGGSALKQVTGKRVIMDGGATLHYDSGLISENFSSGPGGSWQFMPGTYVITN